MLLLDLDTFDPQDRVEAFHHALTDASVPNDIVHEVPDTGMRARIEAWRVGALDLVDARSTGFEVRRTARHVRWHRDRPVVSVSLQSRGVHHAENGGERYTLGSSPGNTPSPGASCTPSSPAPASAWNSGSSVNGWKRPAAC
ncbi:hypothetical protein ACFYXM_29215 [Streptomyces sp. NPDC002476]|uniref:AraC-like ligand-binding domain-containing protein n=1 Tax=Streptomyces sp. NPDC002476 TaxID=3364648 RepID=UPI003689EE8A